jgi:Sec-independent protein translocase protein TatA
MNHFWIGFIAGIASCVFGSGCLAVVIVAARSAFKGARQLIEDDENFDQYRLDEIKARAQNHDKPIHRKP